MPRDGDDQPLGWHHIRAPIVRPPIVRPPIVRQHEQLCGGGARRVVFQQQLWSDLQEVNTRPLASLRRSTSSTSASESSPDSSSGMSGLTSASTTARTSRSTSVSSAAAPHPSRCGADSRSPTFCAVLLLVLASMPQPSTLPPIALAPLAAPAPPSPSPAAAMRCGSSADSNASILARNGYGSRRSGAGACGASMACMASHSCSLCARYSSGRIAAWKEAATSCDTHIAGVHLLRVSYMTAAC
eukprot:scaffold708_cov70-Phaeocystis_antarctica.AAC.4